MWWPVPAVVAAMVDTEISGDDVRRISHWRRRRVRAHKKARRERLHHSSADPIGAWKDIFLFIYRQKIPAYSTTDQTKKPLGIQKRICLGLVEVIEQEIFAV